VNANTAKGNSVRASARPDIAEDSKRPRADQTRLRLVVPIGVLVAVAIICIIVAVLSSARRADEVSFNREQKLIQRAITDRGARVLRELESVATTHRAVEAIRRNYNPQWVERRVGNWLESYFDHDLVAVIDASDQVEYVRSRSSEAHGAINWPIELGAMLDLLRGRTGATLSRFVPVVVAPDTTRPSRVAAVIQRFTERPAIVAAVVVGSDDDFAAGNTGAPIVVAVKYIDDAMLQEIGARLQLPELRQLDDQTRAGDTQVIAIADAQGNAVVRFAWKPTMPGGQIVGRVLPFMIVALAGFAALIGLVMYHMRRTAEKITTGETQLRHLALHDPVCGLPNRI